MAFIFWSLFIVSFFTTLFVIIKAIQKKYHGWKSFFIPLIILNLVVAGLYLVLTVIAALTAHDGGGIGLAFIGLGFLIIGIIPVAIVVVLCILLFLFKSHPRTTPKNGSYTFHVDYVFVVVTIMAIIAIAWWIISHVF